MPRKSAVPRTATQVQPAAVELRPITAGMVAFRQPASPAGPVGPATGRKAAAAAAPVGTAVLVAPEVLERPVLAAPVPRLLLARGVLGVGAVVRELVQAEQVAPAMMAW